MIHAVIVVLVHDDIGGIHPIHPTGDLLVIFALAGDGVDQHGALDIRSAEQANGLDDAGADPVRRALLVDLKHRFFEHHGRIVEPQVAVQVPAEVLRRGVLHPLVQADHLRLLGHHVDDDIGRQAVGAVGEPFDQVAVPQGSHPHRPSLIIELGIGRQDLELGYHVAELAQFPAAQAGGGVGVQHGDLVIADLLHLGGEVTALNGQQLAVRPRPQHHPGADGADGDGGDQSDKRQEGHGALLLDEVDVALDALPLESGGQHGADTVHRAQQEHEHIELFGVEVDRRQFHIEVYQTEHQRHRQIDEGPGKGVADGLPGLSGPLGRRCVILAGLTGGRIEAAAERAAVKAAEIE